MSLFSSSAIFRFFFFLFFLTGNLSLLLGASPSRVGEKDASFLGAAFYGAFLNSQAALDENALFEEKMTAFIQRSGVPGSYHYEVVANEDGSLPYLNTSAATAYVGWQGEVNLLVSAITDHMDAALKTNILLWQLLPLEATQGACGNSSSDFWGELTMSEKIALGLLGCVVMERAYARYSKRGDQPGDVSHLHEGHHPTEVQEQRSEQALEEEGHVGVRFMVDDITGIAVNERHFQPDRRSWIKQWADSLRGRRAVYSIIPGADQVEYIPEVDPLPGARSFFQKIIYAVTSPLYPYPGTESFKILVDELQKQHVVELESHQAQLATQEEELSFHRTQIQHYKEQNQLALEKQQEMEIKSQQKRKQRLERFRQYRTQNEPVDQLRSDYEELHIEVESALLDGYRVLCELKKLEDVEEREASYEEGVGDTHASLSDHVAEEIKKLFEQQTNNIEKIKNLIEEVRGVREGLGTLEYVVHDSLQPEEVRQRWLEKTVRKKEGVTQQLRELMPQGAGLLTQAKGIVEAYKKQRNDELTSARSSISSLEEEVKREEREVHRAPVSSTFTGKTAALQKDRKKLHQQELLEVGKVALDKMAQIEQGTYSSFERFIPFIEHAEMAAKKSFGGIHYLEKCYRAHQEITQLMEADSGIISETNARLACCLKTKLLEERAKRENVMRYFNATMDLVCKIMRPLTLESERREEDALKGHQSNYEALSQECAHLFDAMTEKINPLLFRAQQAAATIWNTASAPQAIDIARQQLYQLMKQLEQEMGSIK